VDAGLDVPVIMGSRSTCLGAGFGGYRGRRLQSGDILNAFTSSVSLAPRALASAAVAESPTLRLMRGPEIGRFTRACRLHFFTDPYIVSQVSNRMGYRLEGRRLKFRAGAPADIITEAASFGTIQVTSDGLPMLLMADHQTTGGYARLGTLISADFSLAAQLAPGDKVWFQEIGIDQAEALAVDEEKELRLLDRVLHWG
jgi:antagonist of KipI